MKKELLLLSALSTIILILLGILIFVPSPKKAVNEGIQTNLKANQEISSPLEITGQVFGNGWAGFEGQVGVVKLLDSNGSQIALGILTATTDWMTLPTSFKTTLEFDAAPGDAILLFRNENASGEPERDKTLVLPVKIKASQETTAVKIFFANNKLDPQISCNKVFSVTRQISKTQAIARVALEELLRGPSDLEKNSGYSTTLNSGVVIQSLKVENGVAYVDFNEQLQYQVGGSCRVSFIRAQIEQTLKQFSTVKNVVISINGRSEDILQP